jgi:hypothetical protein
MEPVVEPSPNIPSIPSFSMLPGTVSIESVVAVIITIVFVWWVVYTLVVMYHWLRYGRESWFAVPLLALHFAVSGWIFVFATGGLH